MVIACFAAGALFSIAQFLFAKKIFSNNSKPIRNALYIAQLLILSFGLLVVMFFISETALLAAAAGLVATSIVIAIAYNLKR